MVSVTPCAGRVPWMELRAGHLRRFHPNIPWQRRIQGSVKLIGLPPCGKGDRRNLTGGVNSAVCSACRQNRASFARKVLQGGLHLPLDRSAPGLDLPPEEIRSVVVDGQPESAFAIWVHADKVEGRECTSRKGWPKPCRSAYPYRFPGDERRESRDS